LINKVGDCTRTFERIAPGTCVAIDGPRGSFIVQPDKTPVLLIAGGEPILGMIEEAAANRDPRPFRFLYAARRQGDLVCLDRLRDLQARLDFSVRCLVDAGPREKQVGTAPLQPSHFRAFVDGSIRKK
jgi:NAD(P)H-flavin reductase